MGSNTDKPVVVPAPEAPTPTVSVEAPPAENVAISLRYWHSRSECLSEWNAADLKRLRKFIDKLQGMTWAQIKLDGGFGYTIHKGPPGAGFSRPPSLSQDQAMIELKVSDRARVHGAESENTFFLVWLDRGHRVFPNR